MAGFRSLVRRFLGDRQEQHPRPSESQATMLAGRPESPAKGNNDFALAMYGELRAEPGNLFFSPFSVRTALAIAQIGARGETAGQMAETLRTSASDETPDAALAQIIRRLNASTDQYEIAVANSLWSQEGRPLRAGFSGAIARDFDGIINLVDFRRSADAAGATINKWVEEKTRRKILNLIPAGGVNSETRLILVNAVYFKGKWLLQFDRDCTRQEPFNLEGGSTVRGPLMHRQEEVLYLQGAGFQAVDLLYEGRNLSMLILLPDRRGRLADLERELSSNMLRDCVARMTLREVSLFLPRFKITWGTRDLCGPLGGLGMSLPFDRSRADFSGMNGVRPPAKEALFISGIYHKAFAEVNEKGTEAAAATAVPMDLGLAMDRPKPRPIPVFRADHPFLFAIREHHTGTILFFGRVANPTEGR